jgi:hypothetical protein
LVAVAAALVTLATAGPAGAQTVWAVGDGGVPETTDDELAAYIEGTGPFDRFLYLGDVYETGTAEEFQQRYHPSFGRFKDWSSPTPGNHEWPNRAVGYDPYWGALAPQTEGGHWYSFDLGGWHFVSLNTEEPIDAASPQIAWLRRDLARYSGTCTVAFMHKPRYTATTGVSDRADVEAAWSELAGRAVAVLAGHDHNYERFHPNRGLVQFVVGTGGRARYDLDEGDSRLAAGTDAHYGALRLRLARDGAQFDFRATGGALLDSGSLGCTPHESPPSQPPPGEPPPGESPPSQPPGEPQPGQPPSRTGDGSAPAPSVSVVSPKHGAVHSRRLRRFRGAVAHAAGPVSVTLVRRGRRCARFDGRSFVRASCRTRAGVDVAASSRWTLSLPSSARLAPGRYRLTARVVGANGARRLAGVTFRVR